MFNVLSDNAFTPKFKYVVSTQKPANIYGQQSASLGLYSQLSLSGIVFFNARLSFQTGSKH